MRWTAASWDDACSIWANDDWPLVARQVANTLHGIAREAIGVELRDAIEFALIAGLRVGFGELIFGRLRRAPRPMLFGGKRDQDVLRIPVIGVEDLRHLEEVVWRGGPVDHLLIFLGGLG